MVSRSVFVAPWGVSKASQPMNRNTGMFRTMRIQMNMTSWDIPILGLAIKLPLFTTTICTEPTS